MKDTFRLTWRDVRRATSNVMAIIVMFGLVMIPSLFTWFNVIASWDPFSNTRNLKVAVASTDDGYKSDLMPITINVGEQVLSALRANEQLDWVITSKKDAIEGTRSGEYYAAIVLPPSFSADMLTFYADGGERTHLTYYLNEKKNALAPKVTDQGAEGVSSQISAVFTETLSDVALGLVSSLSDFLNDGDTQAALTRLETRVGAVSDQLRAGARTATMFSDVVGSAIPLVDSASALISASQASFDDASDAVAGGSAAVDSLRSTVTTATQSLNAALDATASAYDAVGARVDELFAQLDSLSAGQVDVMNSIAGRIQQQIDQYTAVRATLDTDVRPLLPPDAQGALDTVLSRLDEAIARQQAVHDRIVTGANDLAAGSTDSAQTRSEIANAIAQAKAAIADAKNSYANTLKPQLDRLGATLGSIQDSVAGIGADLNAAAGNLSGSGGITDILTKARSTTDSFAATLTKTADKFDALRAALQKGADTGDLSDLKRIIGSDPSVLATSLAAPVRVDREAIFPVVSFGAAMSPLYIVLALWVGALLMTVAIRADVSANALPETPELSPTQKYLGRYGVFGLTGLAQSTLVALGLILFVQVEPVHPFLFLLAAWVISLVFTLLIYTAVVAFGNAGKALAVLLLVIQISGSGGAYPLQLLPPWFQGISPFLPATHAINALRAALAGTYEGDYWTSVGWLLVFVLPALLLGLVLRRPLMSFNRGLVEALESTKLM